MDFIGKYFQAERSESLLFIVIGILSILAALVFWLDIRKPFYNGMAWPLLLVALIQLIVGLTVFLRSPQDMERVNRMAKREPYRIDREEIPRMEQVMKNFMLYRWVEIALSLAGLALILSFREPGYWKGVGAGLFLQAGLMLLLDFFAERRGQAYLEALRDFIGG